MNTPIHHRLIQQFVLLIVGLLITTVTTAQTNWGGIIQNDETLTAAGSPYIVNQNTLIMEGVTLTIEPGTVIRFRDSMRMQVNGTIRAIGTATDSIVFTRVAGSTSGWGGLHFHHLSEPYDENTDHGCKLSYVQIKHTIHALVSNSYTYVLIANNASPLIEHSEISCFEGELFFIQSGSRMSDCSIHDCQTVLSVGGNPAINQQFVMERCHIHSVNAGFNAPQTRTMSLSGNVLIKDCVFEQTTNEIGIAVYSNQVKIRNNVLRNGKIGIALLGGWQPNIEITGNHFTGNNVNVLLSACQRMPLITGNDFMDYQAYSVEVNQYHYPFLNEDCLPIDTYFNMNLEGNYWGTTDTLAIKASIHDFYDDFLQQVIVDFDNFAQVPYNTADETAASLPANIHCTGDMGLDDSEILVAEVGPNPAQNNQFQLKTNAYGTLQLSITDLSGRTVHTETFQHVAPNQPVLVKVADHHTGCLLIRLTDSAGKSGVFRITFP